MKTRTSLPVPFRLVAVFGIFAVCAVALAASLHVFELPDHGALTLMMPNGWTYQLQQPPNRLPPTILLKPRLGAAGQVLITTIWPIAPAIKIPDEATLRSDVVTAAKTAESQSVEHELPVQEFKGLNGRGFYFSATDRGPSPEYKHLTQGVLRIGDIALAFTVLTNDREDTLLQQAFEMLRTGAHRRNSSI